MSDATEALAAINVAIEKVEALGSSLILDEAYRTLRAAHANVSAYISMIPPAPVPLFDAPPTYIGYIPAEISREGTVSISAPTYEQLVANGVLGGKPVLVTGAHDPLLLVDPSHDSGEFPRLFSAV